VLERPLHEPHERWRDFADDVKGSGLQYRFVI